MAVNSSGVDLSADAATRPGRFHLPMKKQVTAKPSLPILTVRGERVVIDFALARIYGVATGRFNEAVRRNLKRFPADFSFVVTRQEYEELISQNAISKPGRGGRTKLPRVFTEHGALMAASILNSERAIAMSVYVIRAFVEIRERLATNAVILKRLASNRKRSCRRSRTTARRSACSA